LFEYGSMGAEPVLGRGARFTKRVGAERVVMREHSPDRERNEHRPCPARGDAAERSQVM